MQQQGQGRNVEVLIKNYQKRLAEKENEIVFLAANLELAELEVLELKNKVELMKVDVPKERNTEK